MLESIPSRAGNICHGLIDGLSICILTLTRVFISQYYERNNVTKQNAIVALITGLEPVIGVINACLPFFPPVLHRIGDSKLYLNIRRSFRSTKLGSDYGQATSSHRSNRHDVGSSRSRKVPHSSKQKNRFKGLSDPDTEMDMLHQAYRDIGHQRSYKISVGSLTNPGNACEEGTLPSPPSQVWDANMPRIQVRKDFSVDSDTRV